MTTYNVESELVNQKNKVLELVNDQQYREALTLLDFAAPLWAACGYEYKSREIRRRIKDEARQQMLSAAHSSSARKWERVYDSVTV